MVEILYFFSETCPPCKALKPRVEAFGAETGVSITFIDAVNDTTGLADEYRVRAVPTVILRRDGVVVARAVGAAAWNPDTFTEALA
jgi:thioredoxin 1